MIALKILLVVAISIGIYLFCWGIYYLISRKGSRLNKSQWRQYLYKRNLAKRCLLPIPGIALYFLLYTVLERGSQAIIWMHKLDIIYLTIVFLMIANSLMLTFLDIYSHTDKNKAHPLKGVIQGMQVILFFIGAIIIIAILFDKSPGALLTGLGASAAVLMLIFKDSILGFVAGVQLSQNNMIRIGDWIQMPDGSANGTVMEITLNTVKVRNWDNTISTIPPYTLVSTTFRNWRGMAESDGRRVDKRIFLDLCSIEFCSEDMIADIRKNVPLIEDYLSGDASPKKIDKGERQDTSMPNGTSTNVARTNGATTYSKSTNGVIMLRKEYQMPTNSQLYRIYIERYLRSHPAVAQKLDLIIAQREPTQFGVPIEVYFFLKDKVWADYETIQSDIFDHLLAMAPVFGLRLYQLPMQN